jgi:hypothetical protein
MLKIIVWPTLAKQITKGTKLMFSDRQRYNKPPVNASTTPILIPFCNEVIFKVIPANIKANMSLKAKHIEFWKILPGKYFR